MGEDIKKGYAGRPPIYQSNGLTHSENSLKEWCNKTFLSLWSYSNVYRYQGGSKEVCDLLVVFEDHIILFSDKNCAYPVRETPDKEKLEVQLNLDWKRWFKKAILESAKQVLGAERRLRDYPHQLFLDSSCTRPFPINLPDLSTAKFHRILIVHGIFEQCRKHTGGGGSLLLKPSESNPERFTIGKIALKSSAIDAAYFHVFDDHSLPIIMQALDTVTDFVDYLTKKEQLIRTGRLHAAAGEENLLAYYLQHYNSNGEHDFFSPDNGDALNIEEGLWAEFATSSRRKEQLRANDESKAWDKLIERFNQSILEGEYYFYSTDPTTVIHAEKIMPEPILRFLARESRVWRRALAWMLEDVVRKTPPSDLKYRFVHPQPYDFPELKNPFLYHRTIADPCYVFVVRSHAQGEFTSKEKWRELLKLYSLGMKQVYPPAQDIIALGVSMNAETGLYRIEDAAYLNARNWSKKQQAFIQQLLKKSSILKNLRPQISFSKVYPDSASSFNGPFPVDLPIPKRKGSQRNKPCFCGSGKKYKHCHGW